MRRYGEVAGPRNVETTRKVVRTRKRLYDGKRVSAEQLHELEAEVRKLRPSIIVERQRLPRLPAAVNHLFPQWHEFRELAGAVLAAVARLDRGPGGRKAAL